MKILSALLCLPLYFAMLANTLNASTQSQPFRDRFVEAQLISSVEAVVPGETFRVAVTLNHDPHWHTYWKSTATGYATSLDWKLPEGWNASEIKWPVPGLYSFQGFVEYVYDGKVALLVDITPPESFDGNGIKLEVVLDWLMCEDVCVPGSVTLDLNLPIAQKGSIPAKANQSVFQAAEKSLPTIPTDLELAAWKEKDKVILSLDGENLPSAFTFFDAQAVFTPLIEFPTQIAEDGRVLISLPTDPATNEIPSNLSGVLKPADSSAVDFKAVAVDIPIAESPPVGASEVMATPTRSLAGFILLAFVGGLILNLMPCVFPVLGIKIMGFVNQAGEDKRKIVLHGLTFTFGVLLSFWTLAIILIILRSGGEELGWGFQLQSPGFVFLLMMFLFIFGLNMAGLFEFGQSAVGVGSNLTAKSGLSGSFFSGVLATVVATPCAAPFLAPALGAAMTLPPLSSLIVFTSIGLGLSAPYLIFSMFPRLVNLLPRPGAWMETFKQLMSFLLFATVAFLFWVLIGQMSESAGFSTFASLFSLLSIVGIAVAVWIYGRWAAFHRSKKSRFIGSLAAAIFLLGSIYLGFPNPAPKGTHLEWQKWEPGLAEKISRDGNIVYVDFTARWCVTCQTNKAAVFTSSAVTEFIKENNVVLLKADWTNRDPEITQALANYDRSAVPFNLIYSPNSTTPKLLPEILSANTVLSQLKEAK